MSKTGQWILNDKLDVENIQKMSNLKRAIKFEWKNRVMLRGLKRGEINKTFGSKQSKTIEWKTSKEFESKHLN